MMINAKINAIPAKYEGGTREITPNADTNCSGCENALKSIK